ncbi:MAG: hypothetical protein U0797_01690 [Gemmataceae bacterium]
MTTYRTCLRWLAALVACALPALARGETFAFRNDCKEALVIRVSTVQRGVLKRDQTLLKAGESTPKVAHKTDTLVLVLDGKTGRELFRDVLRVSKTPVSYGIVPDPRRPGRVAMKQLEQMPQKGDSTPPKRDR